MNFKKQGYMNWDDYVETITTIEDFTWRQSVRSTFLP